MKHISSNGLPRVDYYFQQLYPQSQKNPRHGIEKSVLVGSMQRALMHAPKVRAFFPPQALPLNERAFEFPCAKFLTGASAAGHLRAMEHQSIYSWSREPRQIIYFYISSERAKSSIIVSFPQFLDCCKQSYKG